MDHYAATAASSGRYGRISAAVVEASGALKLAVADFVGTSAHEVLGQADGGRQFDDPVRCLVAPIVGAQRFGDEVGEP